MSWSSRHGRRIENARLSFTPQYPPLIPEKCRATRRINFSIHHSTCLDCEVATNRLTLEGLRDGSQYLVIAFLWTFILRASQNFDSFKSSVHCFLFISRLTYFSGFMGETTADKATHCSYRLNSISTNQPVNS